MASIESLHTHTTLSDGKLTHLEMFELAQSLGLAVLAFTDHDAVPAPETMAELEKLRGQHTKWIIGIELTAGLPRELNNTTGVAHIIGLFVDPSNRDLLEHCRLAQEARVTRMEKIVKNLQRLGFRITNEDCLEMSGGESVGRPHIVLALAKYPENNIITNKLLVEMAEASSQDQTIQKKYSEMLERGESQYPYTLFLSPDSFKKGYEEYSYMPDLDQAVKIIRDAGGVAILAHYYTVRQKMQFGILEKILSEGRLDGVEVVYGLREHSTQNESIINAERATLRDMAKKYGVLALGGSDAHSAEDLERYVMNDWFSSETVGFTEKILATGKVSKKFSSLE